MDEGQLGVAELFSGVRETEGVGTRVSGGGGDGTNEGGAEQKQSSAVDLRSLSVIEKRLLKATASAEGSEEVCHLCRVHLCL